VDVKSYTILIHTTIEKAVYATEKERIEQLINLLIFLNMLRDAEKDAAISAIVKLLDEVFIKLEQSLTGQISESENARVEIFFTAIYAIVAYLQHPPLTKIYQDKMDSLEACARLAMFKPGSSQ